MYNILGSNMATFEFLPESNEDFDFAIKCDFNKNKNKIRFEIIISDNAEENLKLFLNNIKGNLHKFRTFSDTEKMVKQMVVDTMEPIQQLGLMLQAAADSHWIDTFLDEIMKLTPKNP